MVQPMVVRDMEALLLSPQNACSFNFRKLMPVMIPELSAWTDSDGTSDLCEKYKMEVTAANGKKIVVPASNKFITF